MHGFQNLRLFHHRAILGIIIPKVEVELFPDGIFVNRVEKIYILSLEDFGRQLLNQHICVIIVYDIVRHLTLLAGGGENFE